MQLNIVTNIEVFSFDMTSRHPKHHPDLTRHPPDTFQTHSRHTLDIVFYPIEGSRQEYIMLVFCKQPSISRLPTVRCQHYCWTARMAAWQATPSTCACGWWLQSTMQSLGIRTSSSYNSLMRGEPMQSCSVSKTAGLAVCPGQQQCCSSTGNT